MELEHRTALVTGGASGIGTAIVLAFAAQGARVAACDAIVAATPLRRLARPAVW